MKKLRKYISEHDKPVKAGVRMGLYFFAFAIIGIIIAGIPVLVATPLALWGSLIWTIILTIFLGLSPAYAAFNYFRNNPEFDSVKAFEQGGVIGATVLFIQDLGQVIILFVVVAGITAWNLVYSLYQGFDWNIPLKYGVALLGVLLIGGIWLLGVILFGYILGGIVGWLQAIFRR